VRNTAAARPVRTRARYTSRVDRLTRRQELVVILERGERSFEELRRETQARVRDLDDDLAHLERSLRHGPRRLVVTPAHCIACGFCFRRRERFSTPGRCPVCREGRIAPVNLRVE
jgi:predicted Zn-ribbon and HTH transcriptional regulator